LATDADATVITAHRVAMFRDMGTLDERDAGTLAATSLAYFEDALPRGAYVGWVVERGGDIIGGGGLLVHRGLPRPDSLDGLDEGYLLNVFVEREHRRRGLARRLTEIILAWCRERGITRVALHASEDGRALYRSLGFVAVPNEMRLVLRG
jgi:GNAT superfamily N-acetyltransferase